MVQCAHEIFGKELSSHYQCQPRGDNPASKKCRPGEEPGGEFWGRRGTRETLTIWRCVQVTEVCSVGACRLGQSEGGGKMRSQADLFLGDRAKGIAVHGVGCDGGCGAAESHGVLLWRLRFRPVVLLSIWAVWHRPVSLLCLCKRKNVSVVSACWRSRNHSAADTVELPLADLREVFGGLVAFIAQSLLDLLESALQFHFLFRALLRLLQISGQAAIFKL